MNTTETEPEIAGDELDFSKLHHAYETHELNGVMVWQSETARCGHLPTPGVALENKPADERCCPICLSLINYHPFLLNEK